ncbi:hypothetical protein GCM10020216_080000 [Nonomuraea helvata]
MTAMMAHGPNRYERATVAGVTTLNINTAPTWGFLLMFAGEEPLDARLYGTWTPF